MSQVYLLRNQHQAFLNKSGEWIAAGERKQLYRTEHKDEAINQKVEWAVKHPDVRIEFVLADLDEKGLPAVELPRLRDIETEDEPDLLTINEEPSAAEDSPQPNEATEEATDTATPEPPQAIEDRPDV